MIGSKRAGAIVAALAVLLLAGCGRGATAEPAAATASAAAAVGSLPAATTAPAGRPEDPQGQAACSQLAAISTSDDLYSPDAVEPIGDLAARSTDAGLQIQGRLLLDRAKLARAAKGQDDELSATMQMASAATELGTYCIEHGYTKP